MKKKRTPSLMVITLPNLWMYAIVAAMIALLLLVGNLAQREEAQTVFSPALFGVSIVIDAGHGGYDPGMVGENSVEKEINLAVALALAEYCRAAGASVALTRESDLALGDTKQDDMQARVALVEAVDADIFLSLHCNSYVSSPSQHGSQVFYQKGNEEGQLLAETLQDSLVAELANTERVALPHRESYLLQNIERPAVICEMGFLSNSEEEALLLSSEYHWQLAWALYRGLFYFLTADMAQEN